jgi:oligo-1,6-glucosidase
VVRLGDFALVEPEHPHVYAFTRSGEGRSLFVAGNFSGDPQQVGVAGMDRARAELVLGNYADPPVIQGDTLSLRPWEAAVLRQAPARG